MNKIKSSHNGYDALTGDQIDLIIDLLDAVIETDGGFKILAQKDVNADPSVFEADDVVERLAPTKWFIEFTNGRTKVLTFTLFMVFLYNVRELNGVMQELWAGIERAPDAEHDLHFTARADLSEIMRPDVVRGLLGVLKKHRKGE